VIPDADKALYARQILLPELGLEGQARLAATELRFAAGADPRVCAIAREYLQRAGVRVESDAAVVLAAASRSEVAALAAEPALEECAAWLLGALTAVEAIKTSAGAGTPVALDPEFSLAAEVG
jgi:hypothetical protein